MELGKDAMTLADSIIEHCKSASAEGDGYGALMGMTIPLKVLLGKIVSQRIKVADGVEMTIPAGCMWQASNQADGGVQIAFSGALPRVYTKKMGVEVSPEITAVVVRIDQAAFEATFSTRGTIPWLNISGPLPAYTITVPL